MGMTVLNKSILVDVYPVVQAGRKPDRAKFEARNPKLETIPNKQ